MSEPKRYTDLQVWEALHFAGSTNGWIRWEDYKRIVDRINEASLDAKNVNVVLSAENSRLKAEVERLRASSFVTAVPVEEYEKLKAEVERLRKAGDAMVKHIRHGEEVCYEIIDGDEVIQDWNTAKEGKQP